MCGNGRRVSDNDTKYIYINVELFLYSTHNDVYIFIADKESNKGHIFHKSSPLPSEIEEMGTIVSGLSSRFGHGSKFDKGPLFFGSESP